MRAQRGVADPRQQRGTRTQSAAPQTWTHGEASPPADQPGRQGALQGEARGAATAPDTGRSAGSQRSNGFSGYAASGIESVRPIDVPSGA